MATNFPSAHNICARTEIGPTSTGEGPPVAWLGTVRGVRFLGGKVRYDIEDKDGFLWGGVDSAVVRVPGVPNDVARADDLFEYLDQQRDPDPANVVRMPRPK